MSSRALGFFFAALGAVLFATKAIVAKFTYRYGIDAVTLITFRMLFAFPLFALVALWETRKARLKNAAPIDAKTALQIVALGLIGYWISSLLDFIGLQYISAGLERSILFLSPTFVLMISAWWFRRKISRLQWVSLALAYTGVIVIFLQDIQFGGERVVFGSLCVLGAAFTYAWYLMGSGELVQKIGSTRLVSYMMCVSCVVVVTQFFLTHDAQMLVQPRGVYLWSVVHAVMNTLIPVFLVMWSVERLGAPLSAQISMIGPVALLFMAAAFLDEPLTWAHLAGTALVIGGMLLLSRVPAPQKRSSPASEEAGEHA